MKKGRDFPALFYDLALCGYNVILFNFLGKTLK